ncbi:MAG: rhodanese-like domain-containing protein [Bdellovibrionaceae bacterium]|nr:rhodanese-like domain-containing protein [Pseudobdellovibrionaceae bacterium]
MSQSIVHFENTQTNPDIPYVQDVSPEELLVKKDQVVLVDVRQPDEFTGELGHIPGSKLIVLNSLPEFVDELPQNATIVFICRSGARSARATAFVRSQGFEHAYNLQGGMMRWNSLNFETEGKA